MKLTQKSILATLLLAGIISTANAASVTYDYVGNSFEAFRIYDPLVFNIIDSNTLPSVVGPRITGSATFADGIDNPVTSYMLTDGFNTITNSTAETISFQMTFINGNVDTWFVILGDQNTSSSEGKLSQLYTRKNNAFVDDSSVYEEYENNFTTVFGSASNRNTAGSWMLRQEQVSAVPVPAALPLMASALGLFGFARRLKQSF